MKVANLNKLPNRRANLKRTGHDMSQEFSFTASTGMILPAYQDYVNAGETLYYSGDLICRTQPLVTAAMCDVDIYLDWFFVPAQMLFTLFGSKRWMTNDLISSFYDNSNITDDVFPLFNIQSYLKTTTAQFSLPSNVWYSGGYNATFECLGKSQFRLANHLGFNPYGIFEANGDAATTYTISTNPNVFPLFALAYQAIYQDYFRLPLDSYIRRNVNSFNVDQDYTATTTPYSHTALDSHASLFLLHYRPLRSDYFNSAKVSPMVAAMNVLGSTTPINTLYSKINNYLGSSASPNLGLQNNSGSNTAPGGSSDSITQYYDGINNNRISTSDLRNMFALEKLVRVVGRSKMDYDSQVLAHFGFEVPHDVKHELSHLKEQHTILHIGEVISTADTYSNNSGSALGAIGGKGYGIIKAGKPFKFTAPVDGVIMCTFSATPRMRYYSTFDKQNSLTDRISFYQPEFDKLGMQPIFKYENYGFTTQSDNGSRVGWQFRYEQWKRKYDRVSEAFATPSNWGAINQNSAWVVSKKPYGQVGAVYGVSTLYADNFLSRPSDLNSIMIVPYTPSWDAAYLTNPQTMFYTDPFICQFRANVKKVSVMSAYGEPDLGTI